MAEAKERKQTAFEDGWVVSFDEVGTVDVTVGPELAVRSTGRIPGGLTS